MLSITCQNHNIVKHESKTKPKLDGSGGDSRRLSYPQLKKQLCSNTIKTGLVLSSYYFYNEGFDKGISMSIGATASTLYMYLLCNYVDKITEKPSNFQLLVPFGANMLEYIINASQDQVHLDYLTTFIGFVSYKIAILTVLFDEVSIMIKDDLIELNDAEQIQRNKEIVEVVDEIINKDGNVNTDMNNIKKRILDEDTNEMDW